MSNLTIAGIATTATDLAGTTYFEIDQGGVSKKVTPAVVKTGLGLLGTSVDNTIPRYDGTAGNQQSSGVQIDDNDALYGYLAKLNLQTGTTYTIDVAGTDTDSGKIIDHANASAIAVTLPATAPVGFACTYVQGGAGQITFASTGSGTLVNRQSHTKTAGQNAVVFLYVRSNAGGSAAVWVLGGDTAS